MITSIRRLLRNLRNGTRGVTAMEYGLIASMVAIAVVAGLQTYGVNLSSAFTGFAGQM